MGSRAQRPVGAVWEVEAVWPGCVGGRKLVGAVRVVGVVRAVWAMWAVRAVRRGVCWWGRGLVRVVVRWC